MPQILLLLVFIATSSITYGQKDSLEILENCRLSIIVETTNFYIDDSTLMLESDTLYNIDYLKDAINKKIKSSQVKTIEFLTSLIDNGEYNGGKGPEITDFDSLQAMVDYIDRSIKGDTKETRNNKYLILQENCIKIIDQCKSDLEELSKFQEAKNKEEQNKKLEDNKKLKEKSKNDSYLSLFNIISIVNLVLLLVLIALFFLRRRNQNKINIQLQKLLKDSENSVDIKIKQSKDPQLGNSISNLNVKFDKLESDFVFLKTNLNTINHRIEDLTKPQQKIEEKPVPKILNQKFADFPDMPNGFQLNTLSDTKTSNTRYVITIIDQTTATFRYEASPSATEYAINNSQMFLKTACQYLNSINEGNMIKTEIEGKLVMEANIWRITEKAQIRFHN